MARTSYSGRSKAGKASQNRVYDRFKNGRSTKASRRALKGAAKAAYRRGEKKFSRKLWGLHTRQSSFAAGVKAAKRGRRY